MLRRILPLLTAALILGEEKAAAQDIHFSQFYETTILRNPALTGIFTDDYRVSANYRNQWSSISQPFVTGQVCFETKMKVNRDLSDFFSFGLQANYDKAGTVQMKTLSVYPSVSYNKSLEDGHHSFLSVGFTGGFVQRSIDMSKASVNNQYGPGGFDPYAGTGENLNNNQITHFDLGAGISFSSGGGEYNQTTYFVGASAYHLTKPKQSFYGNEQVRLQMRYNLNAGLTYRFDEYFGLMMQGNYMMQGSYTEIIGGGLFHWKRPQESSSDPQFVVYGGAFYRVNDAIIPVIKLDYMRYSFGFSYDVNVSELKAASGMKGGYELSVVKTGMFRESNRGRTVCPHFFY